MIWYQVQMKGWATFKVLVIQGIVAVISSPGDRDVILVGDLWRDAYTRLIGCEYSIHRIIDHDDDGKVVLGSNVGA